MVNLSLLIYISSEELRLILAEDMSEDGLVLRDLNITILEEWEVREGRLKAGLVCAKPLGRGLISVLSLVVLNSGGSEGHVNESAKASDIPIVKVGFLSVHIFLI